jgi:hypothetical protein
MTLKGRHWVMLWLLVALVALASVAARQTSGFNTAKELRAARDQRSSLEAQRGELERRIRQASSREVLVPRAVSTLGLHEPGATEMTVLTLPAESPGGLPADAATVARTDSVRKAPAKPRAVARPSARKPAARRAPGRKPARAPVRRPRH